MKRSPRIGNRDAALRAFDDAQALLPADPVNPGLPFLFLGGSHLDRWRGNALAQVGDAEAINQLTAALAELPASWVRARAGLFVDLASEAAATGNRDAAMSHAREARTIARRINSDRQLQRSRPPNTAVQQCRITTVMIVFLGRHLIGWCWPLLKSKGNCQQVRNRDINH